MKQTPFPRHKYLKQLTLATAAALATSLPLSAEVTVDIKPNNNNQLEFSWQNNSTLPYYLGGARFYTDKNVALLNSMTGGWSTSSKSVGAEKENTVIYKSSIATVKAVPAKGGTFSAATPQDWSGQPLAKVNSYELLLKTGSPGKVDDPIQEDPIDTSDIDALISNPDFYNENYRYIDTLGANGGLYSGGIMDTWLNETQVITHFSKDTWTLHETEQASFNLSATAGDPLYWMSVIMGQEYFSVDMQWMLGKGAQETGAGTGSYNGSNAEGAFGPWEVETGTGTSREEAYPYFFANGTIADFWSDGSTPLNSANVVNGYIYSIIAVRYIYDLFNYASDACWSEILQNQASRYYALSIMLGGYNNGIGDAQNVLKEFWHVNSYESYLNDPKGHLTVEAKMNKGYVPGVIGGVQNLEKGSKDAYSDHSLELIDMDLSLKDIKRFFYGDGGTAKSQGDGGLLRHFDVDRDEFNPLIETAFRKLKGNAPSTKGEENISLRYDFLTLLRVVKREFQITWTRPSGPGEWINAVKVNSKTGGCSGVIVDEEYPYGEIVGTPDYDSDFIVDIHGKDNVAIKDVQWTIDSSWSSWKLADHKSGSLGDQNFTITIPKSQIQSIYGDNRGTFWYMVTDESGNSVVKSGIIKGSPLKSAAAIDINGDGAADSIRLSIVEGALDQGVDLKSPSHFKYSWPTKGSLQNGPSSVEYSNGIFLFEPSDKIGAGTGVVELQYSGMDRLVQRDIIDSVGPALIDTARFNSSDMGRDMDTLRMAVSESVKENFSSPYRYLGFSVDSSSSVTMVNAGSFASLNSASDSLIVTLPKGTIESEGYLWVKLLENGVTDEVDNSAADNSQKIFIEVKGSKTSFGSAEIFDTYGDGYGDSVSIMLNLGSADDTRDIIEIDKILYKWNSSSVEDTVLKNDVFSDGAGKFHFSVDTATFKFGHGVGDIKIIFSNGFELSGNISDKTGPALVKAKLNISDNSRDCDTIWTTITEEIFNNFEDNRTYLRFKEGTSEKVVSSKAVEKVSGDLWRFIFPKNEVSSCDSVKFVFNAGIGDLVSPSNRVIEKNRYVALKVSGGVEPHSAKSFIVDKNGDGIGDSIAVQLQLGDAKKRYTVDSIAAVEYSWSDKTGFDFMPLSAMINKNSGEFGIEVDTFTTGEGEGQINLTFPNDYTINEPIYDSVGPAITTATKLFTESQAYDLVVITTTEKLNNSLSTNSDDFTIFDISGGKAVTSDSVISVDDTTYNIYLPSGTVTEKDSIAFISESGIADVIGNRPHKNNQHIEIDIRGSLRPSLIFADMYDKNGDGKADSILAKLKPGSDSLADKLEELQKDSLFYSWPSKLNLNKAEKLRINSDSTITVTGMKINTTYGNGTIQLRFPSGRVLGDLNDKVGPVITSAELWENLSGDDTLIVTFSEEISGISNGETVLAIENQEYRSPKIREYQGAGVWLFTFAGGTITPGDSVNIIASSNLKDLRDNSAHENNIKVEISEKLRPIGVNDDESGYFDDNADGIADRIELKLLKEVDQNRIEKFSLSFIWRNSDNDIDTFTVTSDKITAEGSEYITVDISSFDLKQGQTSLDSDIGELTLIQPNSNLSGEMDSTTLRPRDKMAPVLIGSALYHGVELSEDLDDFEDTLTLTFSEEIKEVTDRGDNIYGLIGDNGEYTINLGREISSAGFNSRRFIVKVNRKKSIIPEYGDSIRIAGSGSIIDLQNNSQNRATTYVPFESVILPSNYEVVVYPTPYVIGWRGENELLSHHGIDGKGKLAVMVRPFGDRAGEELSGVITIYDAVGNVIVENEEMTLSHKGALVYESDGTNLSGRKLGSGFYRGIITITSETGTMEQKDAIHVMIGIQKQAD